MGKLFGQVAIVVGAWLAIMSAIVCWGDILALAVDEAIAVCVIIVGIAAASKPSKTLFSLLMVAGVLLVLWGIAGRFIGAHVDIANEILIGGILVVLGMFAPMFLVECKQATFYNRQGNELAQCKKVSTKDDDLTAKVVLLGSMPETIFVRPVELVKTLYLIEPEVVTNVFKILRKGYKEAIASEKK